MSSTSANGKTEADRPPLTIGIALELDQLVFPGRRLMYEVMGKVLKDKGVTLTPILFSRFILCFPMEKGLEKLLAAAGKKKVSVDNLVQSVREQYDRQLKKITISLDPVWGALLADAAKANVPVGALSFFPPDTVRELLDRLGLAESLVLHVTEQNAKGRSTPDSWLKLAKAMGLPSRCCLALTTSGDSCLAALVAGMRCVVFPDEYTVHQDFAGAVFVADNLKELRFKELVALLHPCAFR